MDELTDKAVQVLDDQSEIIEMLRREKTTLVPVRRTYALNLHLEIDKLRTERAQLIEQVSEWDKTWLELCSQIGLLEDCMDNDDTWENADLSDFWEFDPWHALRRALELMKAKPTPTPAEEA